MDRVDMTEEAVVVWLVLDCGAGDMMLGVGDQKWA